MPKLFDKPKKVKISAPTVIGFDLDGILAHSTIKRHIFKMYKFYKTCAPLRIDLSQIDSLIQQELASKVSPNKEHQRRRERKIKCYIKKHAKIYIITGRKNRFKNTTLEWLERYNIEYDRIFFFKGTIKSINTLSDHKAKLIKKLKIKIFWEDTKLIAWMLAFKCPECEIRLFDKEKYCYTTINVQGKVFTPSCGCGCGEQLDLDKPLREIRKIGFVNSHKPPEVIPRKPLGDEIKHPIDDGDTHVKETTDLEK